MNKLILNWKKEDWMMKKISLGMVFLLFVTFGIFAPTITYGITDGINPEVQLTKEQKDELSLLHKNLMDQKIGIINKYVEYGVFTEKKGKEIIEHMEKHYNELEKNEFIPTCHKKYKKHQREQEE